MADRTTVKQIGGIDTLFVILWRVRLNYAIVHATAKIRVRAQVGEISLWTTVDLA